MSIFAKILCGVMVGAHAIIMSLLANPLPVKEYEVLKTAVLNGNAEVVGQFLTSGKIDNTTMLENIPLANSILNANQMDLLNFVMLKGIFLRLDDYMDSQGEVFSFIKKINNKNWGNVIKSLIGNEEYKKNLKIKHDLIDDLVNSWVLVSSFFHEIKKAVDQKKEDSKDTEVFKQKAENIKKQISPLLLFTTYKDKTIFEYILELQETFLTKEFLSLFVDMQDGLGNTLLHYAVEKAKYSVISAIHSINSSYVNVKNKNGDTPLILVIKNKDYDDAIIFKLNLNYNNLSFDHLLTLIQFIYKFLLPNAILINSDSKVNLKLQYREWMEQLFKQISPSMFQQVFSYKYDNNNTLLHQAVQEVNSEFLTILSNIHHSDVNKKINQDIVNDDQESPLSLAVKNNHEAVVKILLNLSDSNVDNVLCSADSSGNGILTHVVLNGNLIIFQQIIEYFYKNKKKDSIPWFTDKDGNTLLHLAAFKGNLAMFEQILFYEKECFNDHSINKINNAGFPPLWIAVMYGASKEFITFLLQNGASIDYLWPDNIGLLHYGALGATKDVYMFLE